LNPKVLALILGFGAFLFAMFAISGLVNFGTTLTSPIRGSPAPNGSEIIASASAAASALEVGVVGFLILGVAALVLWRWKGRP
jgi:hypothetical protein